MPKGEGGFSRGGEGGFSRGGGRGGFRGNFDLFIFDYIKSI
jgi:hypothetical protein